VLYLPGSHASQLSADEEAEKKPGRHSRQDEPPARVYVPGLQPLQAADPAPEKVPGAHSMQTEAAGSE
jgi:hypothetical protein